MSRQYSKVYKEHAVKYYLANKHLGITKCANNIGISKSALSAWHKTYIENKGKIPTRGRGNLSSNEAKEIAQLKKELKDVSDALDILKRSYSSCNKKPSDLFSQVLKREEELLKAKEGGLNVSGVLRHLGVSRSGYNTWKSKRVDN